MVETKWQLTLKKVKRLFVTYLMRILNLEIKLMIIINSMKTFKQRNCPLFSRKEHFRENAVTLLPKVPLTSIK